MPERVSYATNLEKVGISAFHEVPAVENVSGTLTGTLAGGRLDASAQDFMLHLAKVFPEPWRYRGPAGCSGAWTTAPSPSAAT